jgi:hypothetical protein
MVEWLAGNRIRGTSTERTSTSGFNTVSAVSGGWKELARTTLGSTGDIINVTSIPDKRYYMVLMDEQGSNLNALLYLGSGSADTSQNYAKRTSLNGGTDATTASAYQIFNDGVGSNTGNYTVGYVSNLTNKEKLFMAHTVHQNTAGVGTEPQRVEHVGKWTNTSNPIDYMRLHNYGGGDFSSGAEVVVLGWDESDTHTTNFWEELASVELGSSSATISSGTFTAKKYLWCQIYCNQSASADGKMRFNSDATATYASRDSNDGGAETLRNTVNQIYLNPSPDSKPNFNNIFIVNNSAKEKLGLHWCVNQNTAGSGSPPTRRENAFKWVNTSSQITDITVTASANTYDAGSIIKVWGSN